MISLQGTKLQSYKATPQCRTVEATLRNYIHWQSQCCNNPLRIQVKPSFLPLHYTSLTLTQHHCNLSPLYPTQTPHPNPPHLQPTSIPPKSPEPKAPPPPFPPPDTTMPYTLRNKTVLITGGSRGLGAEIARKFAAQGAEIAVNYANSREDAEKLVKELRERFGVAGCVVQGVC